MAVESDSIHTLKKRYFALKYRVFVAVESTFTKSVYFIAKREIKGVLQQDIVFVWLHSATQYPHKSSVQKWCCAMEYIVCVSLEPDSVPTKIVYFNVKYKKKMVFCKVISCLCDFCVDSIPTQIVYSIAKRLKKW